MGLYEILAPIGAGGMGEVYRAWDTKLGRDVALKVLPESFAGDPERMARFEREAQVLASLNHPNIATIHGLEESGGVRALVMEVVEGPTLAERIAHRAMPLDEALLIAKQIAEGLEYAHERGIIYRDLKPANVKLTADGKVKILDFGLAKALEAPVPAGNPSISPTLTLEGTRAGVILGTAAYMAPEQARGAIVDKRADIWAFGVVLYEMLTGKRLFEGETISDTLAAVLTKEPELERVPANLRRLLQCCLQKDPKQRLQAIGDWRLLLEKTPEIAVPARRMWLWPSVAAMLLVMLGLVSFLQFRRKPPAEPRVVRFTIPLPEKGILGEFLSLSPDGKRFAFTVSVGSSVQLWMRALDSLQSHPLAGTEGTDGVPFWSFDSRYIVFWTGGKLKKIDVSGGPPQTLCDVPLLVFRGFWTRDNKIVFGSATGVLQVAAGGGVPSRLTTVDRTRQEMYHGVPALLPDGRHFVFQRYAPGSVENGGIYLASLDTKPEAQGLKRLLPDLSMPFYVPSLEPATPNVGYLLFVREGTLMAQRFDGGRLELTSDPVPVAERLGDFGAYSVSETGTLVYTTGDSTYRRLTWYDRQGKATGTAWTPGQTSELNLSRDGSRVAVANLTSARDIWVFEFARDVSNRLTNGPGLNLRPVWSPDGSRIVYSSYEAGGFWMLANPASGAGKEELLRKSDSEMCANDWSRDGRYLLFQENDSNAQGRSHLWFLPMDGDRKPTPYFHSEFNENSGQFSPDGRFVAYVSDQSSSDEVYVSSFPDPNAVRLPISHGGGYQPRWRRDGKELLYFSPDGMLMSVDVTLSPVFKAGVPKVLFQSQIYAGSVPSNIWGRAFWDISPDGQHFLINTISSDTSATLTVVLNWQAALKK